MLFSQINPFVRYARCLNLNPNSEYGEVVALDARLFYALDGYGKIKVNDTEYDMTTHSLLLINSGLPYHIKAPENSVEYIAINFDHTREAIHLSAPIKPETKDKFKQSMLIAPCEFEKSKIPSGVLYIKEISTIRKRLMTIIDEYTQQLLYHSEKCGHLLAECIADSLRLSQMGHLSAEREASNRVPFLCGGEREIRIFQPMKKQVKTDAIK